MCCCPLPRRAASGLGRYVRMHLLLFASLRLANGRVFAAVTTTHTASGSSSLSPTARGSSCRASRKPTPRRRSLQPTLTNCFARTQNHPRRGLLQANRTQLAGSGQDQDALEPLVVSRRSSRSTCDSFTCHLHGREAHSRDAACAAFARSLCQRGRSFPSSTTSARSAR